MNRTNWSNCRRALVSLCVVLALVCVGVLGNQLTVQDDLSPIQKEFDRLVGVMAEIIEPVREMAYVAAQGCNATSLEELDLRAQTVLNLLEGSSSPLFEASVGIPLYVTEGILPTVNAFAFTEGWYDPEVNWPEQREMLEAKLEDLQAAFADLSRLAQQVLVEDAAFTVRSESMEQLCGLLETEQQRLESYLALYGYEIRLSPNDSLQEVIDGARDGAILYLWPHTYNESIEISKNLTLVGTSVNSNTLFESSRVVYGTAIKPPDSEEDAIRIHSDHSILVFLHEITILEARHGVYVSGSSTARMESMTIRDCVRAVHAFDGGTAELLRCHLQLNHVGIGGALSNIVAANCTFFDNTRAVDVGMSSSCLLTDCLIEHTGLPDDPSSLGVGPGAVDASCSDLVLERCIIRNNYCNGVSLSGGKASKLHMIDCQITNNDAGLGLEYGNCNPGTDPNWDSPVREFGDGSHGTVTGWNNYIPGPEEENGNRSSAFANYFPLELDPSFLLEPKPSDS